MTRAQKDTARRLAALSHPLRIEIMLRMDEDGAPWSPREIADDTGAPLGNVSYHVRALLGLKMIRLVRTTPRRGAIEHHYAGTVSLDDLFAEAQQLVADLRRGVQTEARS